MRDNKTCIGQIDADPLRDELYSGDQLAQHAKDTACLYRIDTRSGHDRLLPRLADNEKVLLETHDLMNAAIEADRRIAPAGEWLLDNFYLVEEQIRTARHHLPKEYSTALPHLANGPLKGFPRVYYIARELIAHCDGRIDTQSLFDFIDAYQTITPLLLGELWAIPIMFRLSLIENLRRIADSISANSLDSESAGYFVDQMKKVAREDPKNLILVIADMARSDPPLTCAFVAEMARQLQGQSGTLIFPLTWIEHRLSERNLTVEQMIHADSQAQAADQVSFGNSISSLRLLDTMDWREFVERLSLVEQTLRSDPADMYAAMDFETRDRYRHVIEEIAKKRELFEGDVAQKAVELAAFSRGRKDRPIRASHVGYFLMDEGRDSLLEALHIHPSFFDMIQGSGKRHLCSLYFLGISFITLIVAIFGYTGLSTSEWYVALLILVLLLFVGTQCALNLSNWIITILIPPVIIPKMDYSAGIPEDRRTMVVIPTVVSGLSNGTELLDSLEIRYLANRDANLYFALLTDLISADTEELPTDSEIINLLSVGIQELNVRYQDEKPDTFFLMHRSRTWNAGEGIFMGYERKRGILEAFNTLLSGNGKNPFSKIVGNQEILTGIRYVITLDTDTELPRNCAKRLIGAISHPLNQPVSDPHTRVIREGYGILQPRVALSLSKPGVSHFASLFGGEPGIDPYTRAVSDVYQDAFAEGSYIGKGIYDRHAFFHSVEGRFPENRILSHDLLEGCYARTGLVSDVQVFEEYPVCYLADSSRRHRWIRGDWQIVSWIFPFVQGNTSKKQKNPLSSLSRWKICDNLRRSLVAPATVFLIIISATNLLDPLFWTAFIASLYLIPPVCTAGWKCVKKPAEQTWMLHLLDIPSIIRDQLAVPLITLAFLPYEAYLSLDAIFRSCWRMIVSHHNLLEWTTHQEAGQRSHDLAGFYRVMWPAPFIGALFLFSRFFISPSAVPVIEVFAFAWILSPAIAWWISQPIQHKITRLSLLQEQFLRGIARRTWRFFETYVAAEDNYLPPDNYQEQPVCAVAHRTSPTDIGLSLLASLTAYDFGYIPMGELIERTEKTLNTMGRLKRFRGHFYNWYDTITLEPLLPRYISTVDSGNLLGDLLVLRQGLDELPGCPILSKRFADGMSDTLSLLSDAIDAAEKEKRGVVPVSVSSKIAELKGGAVLISGQTPEAIRSLCSLDEMATEVLAALRNHPDDEIRWWADSAKRQAETHLKDLKTYITWVSAGSPPDSIRNEVPEELRSSLYSFCTILKRQNNQIPTLREIADLSEVLYRESGPLLEWLEIQKDTDNAFASGSHWLVRIVQELTTSSERAEERIRLISSLTEKIHACTGIEYEFLYEKTSNLLSIGYNATDLRRDASFYDLLASEARLTSFIGIAYGQLPQEHWFALGRLLTTVGAGKPTLISWSGSMFEYLMPLLLMPTYENTLLDRTYHAVVARQIEYGRKRGVPWGISESGYNVTDTTLNYQYRAFGVPGLGFKRGLAEDLVIAPYAAAMGLMVNPTLACQNLELMDSLGYTGPYGFYEAVDYTPSRVPPGHKQMVVQSFMVHHQGMVLLSLAYALLNRPMQRRFESDQSLLATMMLLQEKMPRNTPFYPHAGEVLGVHKKTGDSESLVRIFQTANTQRPEVHLLSNGRYHVMVSNSGSGYSRWNDLAVTRWREDPTADSCGTFCYIRDLASGEFWSNGYMPARKKPDTYQTIFKQARAEFRRRDRDFDTRTEIIVSPEDDVELRRIWVTNRSWTRRTIEFTSYAEVVLAPFGSDESHPAFHNLFVQTELVREKNAILATRRPRSEGDHPPWMLHLMTVHGKEVRPISFETDRFRFIGRTNSLSRPVAMTDCSTLSDTAGPVLDPIVAIRCTITIDPQETAGVNIFTGVSASREGSVALIEKYYDGYIADRVSELAWTHAHVIMRQLNATERDAQLYGALASSVIYANPSRRAGQNVLLKNSRGQSGLWGYGISGDFPIVLVRIRSRSRISLIREMVQAHAYWRMKGLIVDLVIWNEDQSGYRQELHDEIMSQMPQGSDSSLLNRKGGIFIRRLEQISDEDRILIETVARAIISDRGGTLAEQLERTDWNEIAVPRLLPSRTILHESKAGPGMTGEGLLYFNGTGGFSGDGREYVIITGHGVVTPAPWVNVIANETFGTVVSESGSAYTWSENSHEFRLTPWMNDPVSDLSGETLYIRDEETGIFWSPTPLPARGLNQYVTRHGFGYTVFSSTEQGIHTELTIYVSIDRPVKFVSLRIRNKSGRNRLLSVTGYVEWVLGELRSRSLLYVITEIDTISDAIFAKNPYNHEFPGRVAFFDSNVRTRTVTGDRYEFIGRNGSIEKPAAMKQVRLSNKVGAGLDPCAAMQIPCELTDGEEREIIFTLGVGRDSDDARNIVLQNRGVGSARRAKKAVQEYWSQTLGAVQIKTPDRSVDLLVNGWLLYQTIACRLFARTGFYQSGGAFGFRDQLQDVMALIHTRPDLMRKQLLLCAGHQFVEGDVQHWWHPPLNRGVRTHCSDDYLWLPFATCRYVHSTRDTGILDEEISFLKGREVLPEEDSYYDLPEQSDIRKSLYEHCKQAILLGLDFGDHGLPRMGSGDWNDGMNLVGAEGKGESVWLGFFLFDLLMKFVKVAEIHHDPLFAETCRTNAGQIRENLERDGWDGEWYRRAYFDSGHPLGSAGNPECMIDSVAQSWAVLSGAARDERARKAMRAVVEHLVLFDDRLITLLTPPFDQGPLHPGYIKGYVPGVRENGGHYSHAAIWVVMAFAALKDNGQAWDLLPFINPVHHSKTPEDLRRYRVEPYVIPSDIYAAPPHTGRGGWTWYSGSAGWMYTLIIESLLGVQISGDILRFGPCIPMTWRSYQIEYRYRSTRYQIDVLNAGTGSRVRSVVVDGITQADMTVHLKDDGNDHLVQVELGE
ncbi:MAG: cyclic beta 1-2 glucan synthetase [Methanospirillaceae archaeon]|nr:cyclic beta 1-2 glucan synthetase [Methanospirillaceae archaeon]